MSESDPIRREAAAKILSEPAKYKVCESCGSIVARKAVTCPNCNAYRFDSRVESVQEQAESLATRSPLSIEKQDYA
jgi:rubrerythrin